MSRTQTLAALKESEALTVASADTGVSVTRSLVAPLRT